MNQSPIEPSGQDQRPAGASGFADLPPEERRRIASMGGRAAHACGRAHEFSPHEASLAGRRGGLRVSADRSHMAKIGKLGGARRALLMRRDAEHAGAPVADSGRAVAVDVKQATSAAGAMENP